MNAEGQASVTTLISNISVDTPRGISREMHHGAARNLCHNLVHSLGHGAVHGMGEGAVHSLAVHGLTHDLVHGVGHGHGLQTGDGDISGILSISEAELELDSSELDKDSALPGLSTLVREAPSRPKLRGGNRCFRPWKRFRKPNPDMCI